jgi:hypothetical protein
MARRFQNFQTDTPELKNFAIAKRSKCVSRFRGGAEIDGRAHVIAQLQMSGNEIGVEMRQKYVLNLERVFGGEDDVLIGVALRINYSCGTCGLVSNDVRGMR